MSDVLDGRIKPAAGPGRHRFAVNDFLLFDLGPTAEPDAVLSVGPPLEIQAICLQHTVNPIRKLLQPPPLSSGKLT